jgi:hypothetical protein
MLKNEDSSLVFKVFKGSPLPGNVLELKNFGI